MWIWLYENVNSVQTISSNECKDMVCDCLMFTFMKCWWINCIGRINEPTKMCDSYKMYILCTFCILFVLSRKNIQRTRCSKAKSVTLKHIGWIVYSVASNMRHLIEIYDVFVHKQSVICHEMLWNESETHSRKSVNKLFLSCFNYFDIVMVCTARSNCFCCVALVRMSYRKRILVDL